MKETEILLAITSVIDSELAKQDIYSVVKSNVQPSVLDTEPTIYLAITSIKYRGFPKRNDLVKATEIEHLAGQLYESVIKITGQVIRDTSLTIDALSITSLELVSKVATILYSDQVRMILKEKGISGLKIEEITQTFYSNDEANKNQTVASFNFTICYEEVSKTTSPVTRTFEFKKYRV